MDVASYLRCFEESLTSYSGDDPLDAWDKFVDFLEQRLPVEGSSEMSLVFDALVLKFLNVDRYANDIRYINYCIRCASYYSDPIALYTHIFSKGVGTRTAALYVAWAQQFEQRGMNEQADSVYQKALENQVQPADIVLHEYRQFQSRTRTQPPPSGARVPLQNSQLTNQMCPHTLAQNKAAADCPSEPLEYRTVITVSRSETSGTLPSSQSADLLTVSQYNKDELVCEGSEFCFEEVRAAKYFRKIQKKQEQEQREIMERKLREQEEEVQRLQSMLEHVNQGLEACGALPSLTLYQEPSAAPTSSNPFQSSSSRPRSSNHLSSRLSLGLRLHSELNLIQEAAPSPSTAPTHPSPILFNRRSGATAAGTEPRPSAQQASSIKQTNLFLTRPAAAHAARVHLGSDAQQTSELSTKLLEGSQLPEPEEKLNVSQGGTANLSHVTPNTSLGFVQATPSRVLPSPTVNTREALGVIMDMFQAPTFLDKPYESTSMLYHAAEKDLDVETSVISSLQKPSACAQFSIFQDDEDKENGSAAASPEKSKPGKALAEISAMKADKPNETPSELIPDESTMWGTRYNSLNSLAACPNSTTDFAMLAQFVSTPFTHKTPFSGIFFQAEENNGDSCDGDENVFIRRQTKKLSPIMEQSPSDDKASESAVSQLLPSSARQGTIMSDGFTSTSISMVQPPPPAVLSFRDQTLCPTQSSRSARSGWEVYTDPEQPPRLACQSSVRLRSEPFKILEDPEKPASPEPVQNPVRDVPMSPECAPKASWLNIRSPEATAEQDLDAFLSPCRPSKVDTTSTRTLDVPMSPEPLQFCVDTPMSSQRISNEPMMSPDRKLRTSGEIQLVSDPWDTELISDLLSKLSMPLTSHPCCVTWPCDLPSIGPKMTLSMGSSSLRVDCVLGEGAFATVYQATDPMTSEKMVLKVQKPANPWEFYINTCLDDRLQPAVRHLFCSIRSAHLFHNGSVMLGELHNYGTLLNAVNIYRTLSDKVMPQPLILYFAVCILHMVEQLHSVHVIHADIKPDNFMLGERFLENKCFDSDSVDHGLVLIDLGQSIDMQLFPEGTAFTARCLTSGFQCTEMLSGKPWTYQTDYFGIAGTVYCMLFGTYMQVTNKGGVWKTNGVFRRNPHSDLWLEFFDTLLNVPDCGSLPSLRSLRCRLTSVLQQNYSSKLATMKSRLVIKLLENHRAARR